VISVGEAATRQAAASENDGSGGSAPFFLYIAAQSIHTPLEAPDEYVALYPDAPNAANNSDAQLIHAMVSALDDLFGNVTEKLKSTGLWDSTIMVFTADNGGDTHGNNFPLRGIR
jgi:arylsulfatase B